MIKYGETNEEEIMIIKSELESVKSQIIQVIGDRIPLKRRGTTWWGRCPFHVEKTASFAVSEPKRHFKCFSCGVSGDVLDFLRIFHKTDFRGAVAMLGVADGKPSHQDSEWQRAKRKDEKHKAELKAHWNQLAAGLRYIRRLIVKTEPLERDADWFTAELILDEKLDELEAELRK